MKINCSGSPKSASHLLNMRPANKPSECAVGCGALHITPLAYMSFIRQSSRYSVTLDASRRLRLAEMYLI